MNWKYALIWLLFYMIFRLILSYFGGWNITQATLIVAIVGSLIFGYVERNKE